MVMNAATQGDIKVECGFPLTDITALEMVAEKNWHTRICIKGNLPEEEGDSLIFENLEGIGITVRIREEIIFIGQLKEVLVSQEGKLYGVELIGISATQTLDCEKRNRSFQDAGKTYGQIIRSVLMDTPGARAGFQIKDREIGVPVYQVEETDWEFILRMASRLGAGVIPAAAEQGIRCDVGLHQGRKQETADCGLNLISSWGDRKRRADGYEVTAYANWEIGDRLELNGMECRILNKRCRLRQGLIQFTYLAGQETVFTVEPYGNPALTGRLLPGTVMKTKAEQVQVRFDMDTAGEEGSLYWYPWHPEAGNLMYCMPETGQKIYVRLDDEDGARAEGIYGIHENGEGNGEMDPRNRYFTTAEDKRMYLLPDVVGFTDLKQGSPLKVEVSDDAGISLTSNKRLAVIAKETVGIKGKNVSLQAPKEISIVRRGGNPTVINMCNGFDSVGLTNEVRTSGTGDENFPIFPNQDGGDYLLGGTEQQILSSTPSGGFADDLERQIEGSLVNKVIQTEETGYGDFIRTGGR